MLAEIGKALIFFGLALVFLGLVFTFLPSLSMGRLPGDILVKKDHWSFYFPLTTSVVLSLVLTLLFLILNSLRR